MQLRDNDVQRLTLGFDWSGILTHENVEAVGNHIFEMLKRRKYTFVSHHENFNTSSSIGLDVRVDQRLRTDEWRTGKTLITHVDPTSFSGFDFADTYGVWGVNTYASDDKRSSWEKEPYIVIKYARIEIYQYSPSGHLITWKIVVQED